MLDLFKGSLRHFQAGLRVAPVGSLGQAAGWHCPLVATREYSRACAELVAQELKAPPRAWEDRRFRSVLSSKSPSPRMNCRSVQQPEASQKHQA